jgi:predicted RNase H-like HicB family nuclease
MDKSLEYYLSLPYPIELIPDEDGFWFAQIPLLPGCMTEGSSREEALEMLDEAKELWLETALDRGIHIPEPETAKP